MSADAAPSPTFVAPVWSDVLTYRHLTNGPRHEVYPPLALMDTRFAAHDLEEALAQGHASGRSLSVYVHVPFCRSACFHCDRYPILDGSARLTGPYLASLEREMALFAKHLRPSRTLTQLYWSGGTPTLLSLDQMSALVDQLDFHFGLSSLPDRDYAIDIDPRETNVFTLRHLQALGFNRLNLGVQDLNPQVQRAINRIQPRQLVEILIDEAMRLGFRSLNIDLTHGLPHQTQGSFQATLEQVIELMPARISLHDYAHQPQRVRLQRRINGADLPGEEEKLAILRGAHERLGAANYQHLGMGYFVRRDDSLAIAQRGARLKWTLQGFSAQAESDLIGLGVAAISQVGNYCTQNATSIDEWQRHLDTSHLAVARGMQLSLDQQLRRYAIERLVCDGALDFTQLSETFGVDATEYFADILSRLIHAERDGLIERDATHLRVTPLGRLAIRYLASTFVEPLAPDM
ncbi:oxygen-independent coproporphyrinogen III oxidase [Halomonas sp. WWR20]